MSIFAKSSSKTPEKPRSFFARINLRLPWLKLVVVIFIGLVAILDLLDLTISKLGDLSNNFPTAPMAKHVKATERTFADKKLVALTFDDGPSSEVTPRLLDLLTEKNTVATFFMLGRMVRNNPEILKRARNEGHEIASHTMHHQNLIRIPVASAEADINEAKSVFVSITGQTPSLTRPPYGNSNDAVSSIMGTPLILWSVDTLDWKSRDPAAIIEVAMNQVHDGAIILMHDIYPTTAEAVSTLIDILRADGYEFATISELARARNINLSAGVSYYSFRP